MGGSNRGYVRTFGNLPPGNNIGTQHIMGRGARGGQDSRGFQHGGFRQFNGPQYWSPSPKALMGKKKEQ